MKLTINNPTRTRKWGWGYSTTPTGEDAYSIKAPAKPDYVGTLKQVCKAQREDRTFSNLGGVFSRERWFYDGKRIIDFESHNPLSFSIRDLEFDKGPITLILEEKQNGY